MNDLVYTDANRVEIGVLSSYSMDLAYGEDENDFVIGIPYGLPIEEESLLYIDDTEWGGMVRGFREDTTGDTDALYALGQTWHGLLAETVLCPPAGSAHVTVQGDANDAIAYVVDLCGKGDMFDVESAPSGIAVDFQFDRFCTLYDGLRKMLSQSGAKLKIAKDPGCQPRLYAAPVDDYSDGEKALQFGYVAERVRPVNHLVCAGQGENEERIVIHLYADEDGNVSFEQTLFGAKERSELYNYTSADYEKLLEDGTKKLREAQNAQSLEIRVPAGIQLDIGDIVGTQSEKAELQTKTDISKVIVVIGEEKKASTSYKTSAANSTLYTKG